MGAREHPRYSPYALNSLQFPASSSFSGASWVTRMGAHLSLFPPADVPDHVADELGMTPAEMEAAEARLSELLSRVEALQQLTSALRL